MAGSSANTVCCCFCGQSLHFADAVLLVASTENMGQEEQKLFAHKKCFTSALHSSVPLHPDLSESSTGSKGGK